MTGFSLTSRIAGETKGDYEKRMAHRIDELNAIYGDENRRPIADGLGWTENYGKGEFLVAYVSLKVK